MISPGFSNFRPLLDQWDKCLALEDERNEIGNHLDGNQCIMFFRRGDELFGAPEESRLVFAKLKSNDDDVPPNFKDDAKFIALNLIQSLLGQKVETLFGLKDLPKLQLIDRDNVVDMLMKKKKKTSSKKKKK